jgi:hypothetical protein
MLIAICLSACGEDEAALEPQAPAEEVEEDLAELTYNRDIAPIIEAQCGECHSEGGIGPFRLDDYASFSAMAEVSLAAIDEGTMPPWLPSRDCREYEDERLMPSQDISDLRKWVEIGKPEGPLVTAESVVESPQTVVFEPTHTATISNAYTPNADEPDDYRCFILDLDFDEDTFMSASTVIPDSKALVHHVLVYAVGPEQLPGVLAANETQEGEGYTCFGAPFPTDGANILGSGLPTLVGAWVPGSKPTTTPENAAVQIKQGSKIVMQIHYNMLAAEPAADLTAFQMKLSNEEPELLAKTRPLVIFSLDIEGGEPAANHKHIYPNYTGRTIQISTVGAHMHLLGSRHKTTILREDGNEECLLDIPRWDFNWQQFYQFPNKGVVEVKPGEAIGLECEYDNSAANQPVVNGEQLEPRDVSWGDGSLDEMCMVYLTTLEPYQPSGDGVCAGMDECLASCEEDGVTDFECLFGCDTDVACKSCLLQNLIPCGTSCIQPFGEMRNSGCLESCLINSLGLGGNMTACFKNECSDSFEELAACMNPVIVEDSCTQNLKETCGVEL